MNKNLYYIGIAILALATVTAVLQSILYLLVGGSLFTLASFMPWFFMAAVISLGGALMLLKYYSHAGYTVSFWTALLSMFGSLIQQVLFYLILSGHSALQQYYLLVMYFVLATAVAYGLSLIFSNASERKWLKIAGWSVMLFSITLLVLMVILIVTKDVPLKIATQHWIEWISLFGNIIPVFLILNFRDELRQIPKRHNVASYPEYVTTSLRLACLVCVMVALTLGVLISGEAATQVFWQNKNAEATASFVKLGDERSYTNAKGETLKYLLVKPADYDPGIKYPLVVSLPYGGYEASAAQLLASDGNSRRYPAFLFVPFCSEGAGWGGIPNYPTIDTLVFEAILKLGEEVSIDATRRYVTGVSRGGYGSWHFITARPDLFAAAVPVCGGGDPQLAPGIVNVSVWAFHGALDRNVPVSGSRDMIDAIKNAGGDPQYTEFPDKAHNIWYEVTQTPGLWDWLFKQKKQ
jgi:hypothetical protein